MLQGVGESARPESTNHEDGMASDSVQEAPDKEKDKKGKLKQVSRQIQSKDEHKATEGIRPRVLTAAVS